MIKKLKWLRRVPWPAALLLLVALCLALHLVTGERPWESGLAAAAEEGGKPKTSHYVVTGLWWAAAINLLIAVGLLLSHRVWLRPLPGSWEPVAHPALPPPRTWIALGLAGLLLLVFAVPRMNQSLWSDEEYTMRRAVFEDYTRKSIEDDGLSRRPIKWRDTFWEYRKPNNHVGYSILARLAHDTIPPRVSGDRFRFREPLLRLPALLAALGCLIAVAGWLHYLRMPAAACLAPLVLALHPWYIRYASEARGYSLVMALGCLLVWLLLLGLDRGKWRYWLGFGATQFYLLFTYPGALMLVVIVNLAALWLILRGLPGRQVLWTRWLVACAAGAMAFLQLMTPCLLQLADYLKSSQLDRSIDGPWLRDTASLLLTGLPWHPWDASNPYCRSIAQLFTGGNWLPVPVLALVAAGLGAGTLRFWRGERVLRSVLLMLALPAPFMVLSALVKGTYLYSWYLIFALPFVVALIAAALEWIPVRFQLAASLVFLLLFFALTASQRDVLRRHAVEPMRESVRLTRNIVNPSDPAIHSVVTIGFVQYTRGYDPAFHQVRSAEELRQVLRWADEQGRPAFVNYAMPDLARLILPEVMALVDDPEWFEPVGEPLPGLEPQNTRFVKRYRGPR